MEGLGKHTRSKTVRSLPKMMSFRQQTGCTELPRVVLNRRICAFQKMEPFYRLNLLGHYGCVNAIEFSNQGGQYLASGGDDRRVLLWDIDEALDARYEPRSMKGEHHSNIFCLAFDYDNAKIYSGGNDDQVIVHDTKRGDAVDVFLHEDAVYGLAADPRNGNIYASACADGRVLLWDIRAPSYKDPFVLANHVTAFHAVVYHPQEPRFLATANAKEGIALWDVRSARNCLLRYGSAYTQMNAMSVRFNQSGSKLIALRRRLPAVLYDIHSPIPAVEFNHEGYYNSCTMKSCCFGGDQDQFVLSGSDDFNLYVWKVPESSEEIQQVSEAYIILKGHRQIVNQVRFSPRSFIIASSGVEKVIKLWSAVKYPGMTDGKESPRKMFSRQQYFNLMISSGSALSHDYSDKSKEEDPRMLAFFDSFIQREVDHSFSSDSSDDSALSPDSLYLHFVRDHSDANSSDGDGPVMPSLLPAELGMLNSDSESDVNVPLVSTRSSRESSSKVVPKSNGEDKSVGTSSDAAGCSMAAAAVAKGGEREKGRTSASDAQGKTSTSRAGNGSEVSEGGRSKRQQGSRSSTDSSSSSDESDDFLVMRYRSRLLRRIMRQKSKKGRDGVGPGGKGGGNSPTQIERDRLSSLQQRLAFSRVMKERITAASDSDSSLSDEDDDDFLAVFGQLRQRTDAARLRAASLRRHRIRALAELATFDRDLVQSADSSPLAPESLRRHTRRTLGELSSLTEDLMRSTSSSSSQNPQRVPPTNSSSHPPNTSTTADNNPTDIASSSSHVKHRKVTTSTPKKSQSKLSNAKSSQNFPSTSNGSRRPQAGAAGCSTDVSKDKNDAEGSAANHTKDGNGGKNGFKKFKVNSSGKKRHYRSTNCYSRQNDSDSD